MCMSEAKLVCQSGSRSISLSPRAGHTVSQSVTVKRYIQDKLGQICRCYVVIYSISFKYLSVLLYIKVLWGLFHIEVLTI